MLNIKCWSLALSFATLDSLYEVILGVPYYRAINRFHTLSPQRNVHLGNWNTCSNVDFPHAQLMANLGLFACETSCKCWFFFFFPPFFFPFLSFVKPDRQLVRHFKVVSGVHCPFKSFSFNGGCRCGPLRKHIGWSSFETSRAHSFPSTPGACTRAYTKDQEVNPGCCKSVDWLLNLS